MDGVGAGIYGERPGIEAQISLGSFTTIFLAEVHAIELIAVMLMERQTANKTIRIFSDSQAALEALDSGLCVSRTVWSCREKLNDLGARNSVTLVWVPETPALREMNGRTPWLRLGQRLSSSGRSQSWE